ncbi:restriction endonuclease subunit S [Desulfobacterota bacterium AH_259_B03_O07]|nr:restriction endonuclease subunit S [Desulfobacterota bacterium AH_259_B03_O07]
MAVTSVVNLSEIKKYHRVDAEYFNPENILMENKVLETKAFTLWKLLKGKFISGPFGSEFRVDNYVKDTNFRYVRGKDVKEFFLLDDDNVYIPRKDFERLNKYSLQEGDILISVVGTLGNTAIVDKNVPQAIFSCKSTLYRTKSINTFYLIAYLNCKFGRTLLQRRVRGAVQTGLNIDDLKLLPVFLPNIKLQNKVSDKVKKAKNCYDISKTHYIQAENLLLQELGLKDFKPKYNLSYSTNLSNAFSVHRVDAEYFHPVYDDLIEKLKSKFKIGKLGKMAERQKIKIKPNSEGNYKYIEISDILIDIGEVDYTERPGNELPPNARMPINGGELIISKVRPTRGAVSIVPEELNENVICSSAFSVFTCSSPLKEYLYILTRSIIGKLQMERPTTGTSYPTINDKDVESIIIPILPESTQQKIAPLIQQSHEARKKAKELLDIAKSAVEIAIEKDENEALKYISKYKNGH